MPSLSRFLEIVVVSGDGDASLKVHHLQLQLQMGDCSRNGFLGIPGSSDTRMYPMKLVNIWGNNVPKNPPLRPFQRRTLLSCGILPSVETSLVGPPPPVRGGGDYKMSKIGLHMVLNICYNKGKAYISNTNYHVLHDGNNRVLR